MAKKILLVDDEAMCVLFLGSFLEDEGYDVRTSESGSNAIEIGKEFLPDILITDWMLKDEKNGLDVAKELLAVKSDLKVVFITGMAADALESKIENLPFSKIIEKPIELTDLAKIVQKLDTEH